MSNQKSGLTFWAILCESLVVSRIASVQNCSSFQQVHLICWHIRHLEWGPFIRLPSRPTGNIRDMMIVWSIRGKIIRIILCCIMYQSCAQWYAHTHTHTQACYSHVKTDGHAVGIYALDTRPCFLS